jgi:hypothetical protein
VDFQGFAQLSGEKSGANGESLSLLCALSALCGYNASHFPQHWLSDPNGPRRRRTALRRLLLGFEALSIGKHDNGHCFWAHVRSGKAHLMFAADHESVGVKESTVVLYLYANDLVKLRQELLTKSVKVSEISYPGYMPKGEVCLEDPDGYTVLVGQIE